MLVNMMEKSVTLKLSHGFGYHHRNLSVLFNKTELVGLALCQKYWLESIFVVDEEHNIRYADWDTKKRVHIKLDPEEELIYQSLDYEKSRYRWKITRQNRRDPEPGFFYTFRGWCGKIRIVADIEYSRFDPVPVKTFRNLWEEFFTDAFPQFPLMYDQLEQEQGE